MTPRWLAALVLVGACAPSDPDFIHLDTRWLPLRRVEKASWVSPGIFQARSPVVFVQHTSDFLLASEIERTALLEHERLHALHQESEGLANYLRDYTNYAPFRREEELEATRLQIQSLTRAGAPPSPWGLASFMASHYGGVFDYDWAVGWVASVEASK